MDSQRHVVDFVVRGLDDWGRPSGALLEAAEVALVNDRGKVLGRFRDADALGRFLLKARGHIRLVATETIGLPRLDLAGKYCCYEQVDPDTISEKKL